MLLVDRSDVVLQRLKTVLTKNPRTVVVGTAQTQAEAGMLLQACRPDVVVLDIQAGDSYEIHLCRTIRKGYPKIAVLFFTASDDKRLLKSAILAGAQGYLLKQASGEAVVKAIEVIAAGKAVVDQQLTPEILKWVRERTGPTQRTRARGCSASDLRVLSLIAAGKTNKEIARHLNVTPGVFRARLLKIYKRLGISRRSAAASYFMRWEQGVL
ncbi:DNA-binding response regulator [Nitrospira sp.]|nr:DNA-binding response regulator [Nitrospira sp.]